MSKNLKLYSNHVKNNEYNKTDAYSSQSKVGHLNDPSLRDHIAACLYGGALGDALGYAVEFEEWEVIQKDYGLNGIQELVLYDGKAHVSDDTQMTLFTAEGIGLGFFRASARGISASVEYYIYQSYLCWLQTQGIHAESLWDCVSRLKESEAMNHQRAPGRTCLSALSSGKMGTTENPINNSKGCGGVMRTAPLGFIRSKWSNQNLFGPALKSGAKAAAITHGHPLGWIPAGMFSDIIDRCLYEQNGSLKELIEKSLVETVNTYSAYKKEIRYFEDLMKKAIELAERPVGKKCEIASVDEPAIRSLGEGWVGEEALAIAVYAVIRYPNDIKKALRTAVNHNGDSDSTGAIAGNILGAYLGMRAIPKDWSSKLELTEEIEAIADMMNIVIEDDD